MDNTTENTILPITLIAIIVVVALIAILFIGGVNLVINKTKTDTLMKPLLRQGFTPDEIDEYFVLIRKDGRPFCFEVKAKREKTIKKLLEEN